MQPNVMVEKESNFSACWFQSGFQRFMNLSQRLQLVIISVGQNKSSAVLFAWAKFMPLKDPFDLMNKEAHIPRERFFRIEEKMLFRISSERYKRKNQRIWKKVNKLSDIGQTAQTHKRKPKSFQC